MLTVLRRLICVVSGGGQPRCSTLLCRSAGPAEHYNCSGTGAKPTRQRRQRSLGLERARFFAKFIWQLHARGFQHFYVECCSVYLDVGRGADRPVPDHGKQYRSNRAMVSTSAIMARPAQTPLYRGIQNCTWFQSYACCSPSEVAAVFGDMPGLVSANAECQAYLNFMSCYFCSPAQSSFFDIDTLRITVCEAFCDSIWSHCASARLSTALLSDLYGDGREFCEAQGFGISSSFGCFDDSGHEVIGGAGRPAAAFASVLSVLAATVLLARTTAPGAKLAPGRLHLLVIAFTLFAFRASGVSASVESSVAEIDHAGPAPHDDSAAGRRVAVTPSPAPEKFCSYFNNRLSVPQPYVFVHCVHIKLYCHHITPPPLLLTHRHPLAPTVSTLRTHTHHTSPQQQQT